MRESKILCVDDEPNVLEGLGRILHRKCTLLTATSGAEALALLAEPRSIAVIVSDMRMPQMDGATLLSECRNRHPAVVRLLLTGYSDTESEIRAVNDGQVFRFLTKPCPPPVLLAALTAAVEKYRCESRGRALVDHSIAGSVRALTEAIALAHPNTPASTARQLDRARRVARLLHVVEPWHVEVAVILSQAGYVVLPNEQLARAESTPLCQGGTPCTVTRLPLAVAGVLAGFPSLERAQEALKFQHRSFVCADGGPEQEALPIGSRILKALADLGFEEARGSTTAAAIETLHSRPGTYAPSVLGALTAICMPHANELLSAQRGIANVRE